MSTAAEEAVLITREVGEKRDVAVASRRVPRLPLRLAGNLTVHAGLVHGLHAERIDALALLGAVTHERWWAGARICSPTDGHTRSTRFGRAFDEADELRARRHTPLVTSERAAIKAWLRGHEAASQRRVELLLEEVSAPERAVAEGLSALEALALAGEWPGPRDAMSERSVEEVRALWVRIERRAQAQHER